jgi:hypothetical protein
MVVRLMFPDLTLHRMTRRAAIPLNQIGRPRRAPCHRSALRSA